MKKLFLGIVTIMLAIAIMVPTVNAATISPDKTEMKVGDIVTIKITTNEEVESMEFDLKFDSTKFQYMTDSAKSALGATASNLTSKDVVTVSAFKLNNETAKEVSLQFKAISKGEHVPFKVEREIKKIDGTIEKIVGKIETVVNNQVIEEVVENPDIEVIKIEEGPYVDEDGNIITTLPKTGTLIMIPVICAIVAIIAVFVVKATKSKKANNRRYK